MTYVSPRAQTEKAISASLGAELADSQSQKSRASLGGTPSPCMHSSHGQESSVCPLLRLHQVLSLLIILLMPRGPPDDVRATEEIPDVHVPHEVCGTTAGVVLPKTSLTRKDLDAPACVRMSGALPS